MAGAGAGCECGVRPRADAGAESWRKSCWILSNGDIDVLVSTTIIETGLDIPNANTIIIHDADRMGLVPAVSAARPCRTFQPDLVCVSDV